MLDLSDMRRGLKHVTLLKRLQGQRKPLTDIVAATVREGAVEKLPFKQLEPEFFVYQRFSHVSVNPNVEDDTRFLCSAYTFESDATEFNPQLQKYVNLGPQYAHNFVNQLIDAATIHQMVSTDQEMVGRGAINLNTQRCFVLVGEKGTGKTFFLNHVLSKYTDYLDARNTIWVRLNLVSSRGFDDLTHWIHAQIAKIILRYYDGGSEFISKPKDKTHDFYGHLQGWVKSQPVSSELKLDLESRLFEMYQVFCKKGSERHINPQISHKNICVELYRYCREALGLAFIIVLDGYDQLDIDQYHVQRFESLDSQVKQLFETYEPAGCVFLIVCRNRTFDAIRSSNPYRNFQSNRRFEVKYVSIKKIFEKRIHCIIQEIAGFISGGDRSQFGRRDWKAILTEFEQNLLTNGTLDYLDKALQTNNRSKMQMIQAEFKTHLQKETHQAYKLIEHMVRAGFTYPPLFYEYYVKGDQIISTKLAEAQYESRFLPIITRPPVPLKEDGSPDVRFYSTNSVLHGVRLLQLAISGTEAHSRNKEVSLVTIGEMCRILAGLFDYNSDITRLYIKELREL